MSSFCSSWAICNGYHAGHTGELIHSEPSSLRHRDHSNPLNRRNLPVCTAVTPALPRPALFRPWCERSIRRQTWRQVGVRPCGWTESSRRFDRLPAALILELQGGAGGGGAPGDAACPARVAVGNLTEMSVLGWL